VILGLELPFLDLIMGNSAIELCLISFSFLQKDEYSENVIHRASIGAGDDEPVLVARVQTMMPRVAGSASSDGESEKKQLEKEREEIDRFKELWLSLVEREQRLELRLMDLDDLREQELAVRELENRVGVAAVEARHLELKVSSLREENDKLKAQTSELDAVRAQLGRTKEKLRLLEEQVEVEREEAHREAAALREKVMDLKRNNAEREKELAAEAASLQKANAVLEEENKELARRLQDAEQVSSSVSLVPEVIEFTVLHFTFKNLHHFACILALLHAIFVVQSYVSKNNNDSYTILRLFFCNAPLPTIANSRFLCCCSESPTPGVKMCNLVDITISIFSVVLEVSNTLKYFAL
jgi:hypothetical protein